MLFKSFELFTLPFTSSIAFRICPICESITATALR